MKLLLTKFDVGKKQINWDDIKTSKGITIEYGGGVLSFDKEMYIIRSMYIVYRYYMHTLYFQ